MPITPFSNQRHPTHFVMEGHHLLTILKLFSAMEFIYVIGNHGNE